MMLGLFVFFSLLFCSLGFYQLPEVVQFTTVPDDAVGCQGCRLELSCSILQQNTTTDLPQPELEWIFNGSKIEFHDIQRRNRTTATHRSFDLIIESATAHHSGIYQCRATDGNSSTVCGDSSTVCGDSSICCVPTITISRPARIQIIGDTVTAEPVSIGSSCSDVVVLPCGSRLVQGTVMETLNLTWSRNGEQLTRNSESEVVLSNGDLAINTSSSETGDEYDCVTYFEHRNITLARYRMPTTLRDGSGSSIQEEAVRSDYLRLTSSRVVVLEGAAGSTVELVCEVSVRGEDPAGQLQCVPYNVTWRSSDGPVLANSHTSLAFNNHLLRVGGVSNSSQYCCQVHATGDRIIEECTTIHVVPQHEAKAVDSKTIFLKSESESNGTELNCSRPSSGDPGNYTWYHNGDLIEGFYSSSLNLIEDVSSVLRDVYGVYQCFHNDGVTVREASLVRVLPYGLTNPPGNIELKELPYPNPDPQAFFSGTYMINWSPPVFTGGLTQLQYNVTVRTFFENTILSTNVTSVIVYMYDSEIAQINVIVVNASRFQQISDPQYHHRSLSSLCASIVLYPPTPFLNCEWGLVNLSWVPDSQNERRFPNGGLELHYVNGSCAHTNGSIDYIELDTSPHIFYENGVAVGTHCRLAMGAAKMPPRDNNNDCRDCFCYDKTLIQYSHPVECYVQGYVQFVNSVYQAFENDSSVKVCARAEGYGFAVNISSASENNITPSISHQLDFSSSLPNTQCVNISIIDNDIIEAAKNFTIILTTTNAHVTAGDPALVLVIDDDYAIVDFTESMYTVNEGAGSLEVCASIDTEVEVNITATVYGEDSSANAGSDYVAVNETLLFTPEGDPVQCFTISVIDDNITEESAEVFTLVVAAGDHISQITTTRVKILDNDIQEEKNTARHRHTGTIVGAVLGFTLFLIILMVAGTVSCLVLVKRKQQLQNSYKIPQDDIGSIDWSVEPAVLISTDDSYYCIKRYSESDFDSKTLLDYLGPTAAELDTTVPPLQILSTDQDTMDSDSPLQVTKEKQSETYHSKHQVNCYNVSVESGVVLDSESHVNVRKMSTGSGSCSHSSSHDIEHSYIGMANRYMCGCSECRLQRERLYSKRVATSATLEYISQSNKLSSSNNDSTTLDNERLMDNNEQYQTSGTRLRNTGSSSVFSHEMDSHTDRGITYDANALHSNTQDLNKDILSNQELPIHIQSSEETVTTDRDSTSHIHSTQCHTT